MTASKFENKFREEIETFIKFAKRTRGLDLTPEEVVPVLDRGFRSRSVLGALVAHGIDNHEANVGVNGLLDDFWRDSDYLLKEDETVVVPDNRAISAERFIEKFDSEIRLGMRCARKVYLVTTFDALAALLQQPANRHALGYLIEEAGDRPDRDEDSMSCSAIWDILRGAYKSRMEDTSTFEGKFSEEIEGAANIYRHIRNTKYLFEDMAERFKANPSTLVTFISHPDDQALITDAVLEAVEGPGFAKARKVKYPTRPFEVPMSRFIKKFAPEIAQSVFYLKVGQQHTASFEEAAHLLYDFRALLGKMILVCRGLSLIHI